jgi:hypothetical protein
MNILDEKFDWEGVMKFYDCSVSKTTTPLMSGRLTPRRVAIIEQRIAEVNEELSAPYGRSPNGYPYRCGCEHDCCGCLCGDRVELVLVQREYGSESFEVHLERHRRYNY